MTPRLRRFVAQIPLLLAVLFAAGIGVAAGASTSGTILGLPDVNLSVLANTSRNLLLGANAGTQMTFTSGGGVQVGSPTGGDKGAGTINATALYVGGTAVSAGNPALATVLGVGHVTGGTNISITGGDAIDTVSNGTLLLSPGSGVVQLKSTASVAQTPGRYDFDVWDLTSMGAGVGGGIRLSGYVDTGNTVEGAWAFVQGYKENATNNNYAGSVVFCTSNAASTITKQLTLDSAGLLRETSGGVYGWTSSASDPTVATALDTGLSRVSAGITACGTGAQGSAAGTLRVTTVQAPAATALNLGGAAATQWQISTGGVLTCQTGLGAISQIVGPTDQPFALAGGAANMGVTFTTTGTGLLANTAAATALGGNGGRTTFVTKDSTAVAAGVGGGIAFQGNTSASLANMVVVSAYKENATSGQSQSSLLFATSNSGNTLTQWLTLDSSGFLRETSAGVFGWTSSATDSKTTTALDTGISRDAAGVVDVGTGAQGNTGGTLKFTTATMVGKVGTYNNVATAGQGVTTVYGAGRQTAQTAQDASIATYTPASDGSFIVSCNINVTTSTTHNFTVECAYTDEGGTARVATFSVEQLAGTIINNITNVTGAGPYEGIPLHIRAKGTNAITIRTNAAGTYTTVTYNADGVIRQIQ